MIILIKLITEYNYYCAKYKRKQWQTKDREKKEINGYIY